MEQPLYPYGICQLSAINVGKFVNIEKKEFNWDEFYETTRTITLLMDNMIDVAEYPDVRFKEMATKYRDIGIGIMGFSDALQMMGIPYTSKNGKNFGKKLIKMLTTACVDKSAELARDKGKFHDYDLFKNDVEEIIAKLTDNDEEIMKKVKKYGLRNARHTTIAPTGTTSLSCDASYGMEPCFGVIFKKVLDGGKKMMFINPTFEKFYKNEEWYTKEMLEKIVENNGSLKGIKGIPKEVKDIFVVAHDINHKDRIDMQAAMQAHISSAISSTINLPESTTKEEISDLYNYAYISGCKGITIYRDGCRKDQPISFREDNKIKQFKRPKKLNASTYVVETGEGKMFTTISEYRGKPVELFLNVGKSGQNINTFSEAIGRLISIMLQKGIPVEDIIKSLIGINSDKPVWYRFEDTDQKPTQILSIPDGIAQLLSRYYIINGKKGNGSNEMETCPECGQKGIISSEGCANCCLCGYSKCS